MKPLRVTVHDAWDTVEIPFDADTTIARIKARALEQCRVTADPAIFVVKYRGAAIIDESATPVAAGLQPGSPLIVLRRRRRPVR